MDFQVQRLNQLLANYQSLSAVKKRADSLAIVSALQAKGEQIRQLEYNSGRLQISTLMVENILSFTEKCAQEESVDIEQRSTKQAAADQLVHFIKSLLLLIEQFRTAYGRHDHISPTKLIATLHKSNTHLLRVYEAPWSLTIEIYKIVSFTSKVDVKRPVDFKMDAANQAILFLNKLARIEQSHQ